MLCWNRSSGSRHGSRWCWRCTWSSLSLSSLSGIVPIPWLPCSSAQVTYPLVANPSEQVLLAFTNPSQCRSLLYLLEVLLAALSEPLNGIGSRHWQLFADDNYFDSHGVFTSLVWAAPLLVNTLIATVRTFSSCQ